jgi:hypothetical protein
MRLHVPTLAFWRDEADGQRRLVVVIQAEQIGNDCLVGFRFFEGGNGVCTFEEIELIAESDSRLEEAG